MLADCIITLTIIILNLSSKPGIRGHIIVMYENTDMSSHRVSQINLFNLHSYDFTMLSDPISMVLLLFLALLLWVYHGYFLFCPVPFRLF